jgi:hypothetical protein
MPSTDYSSDLCAFCRTGRLVERNQEVAFHQSTDRGDIFCRLTLPVIVCEQCRSVTWDAETEAIIEEAVRRAYDKLG